jgi:hypothetical protein
MPNPTTLKCAASGAMRKKTLRVTKWIVCGRRLVVRHEVASFCARLPRSTRVTARVASDAIELLIFPCREVPLRSARGNRLRGEAAGPDARTLQLTKASLRLPSLALDSADVAFDILRKKGRRPPVWVALPYPFECLPRAGFGGREAGRTYSRTKSSMRLNRSFWSSSTSSVPMKRLYSI